MEKREKFIDDLFKNELGSHTETPPPMAWDALEKRLDGVRPRGTALFYRRPVYLVMFCSVLLLSISIAKKMMNSPSPYTKGSSAAKENAALKAGNVTSAPIARAANNHFSYTNATEPRNQNTGNANPGIHTIAATTQQNESESNTSPHKKYAASRSKKNGNKRPVISKGHRKGNNSMNAGEEIAANKPVLVYNSSGTPIDKEDLPNNDKTNGIPTSKPDNKSTNTPEKGPIKPSPMRNKQTFTRFEAGIKAGYESGFDNDAAKKPVISPYVQYNLSPKFAIMLQPAIKSATIQTRMIGSPKSYYKDIDSNINPMLEPNSVLVGGEGWMSLYHYDYSRTYDSILKSYTIGGNYTEYEFPILLKYNLSKSFSIYGGVNIIYSKLIGINGQTYAQKISRSDSTPIELGPVGGPAPAAQFTVSQEIPVTGTDISYYKNPYPSPQGSLIRFGYMIGFSYDYNRWLFDGLIEQNPVASNIQAGYNVNSALSAAYFRLTIGYQLIK